MIINVPNWWCQEWQHCSCPHSRWCTLHVPNFLHYPAILLPNAAVRNTWAWDLDKGLKIEVSISHSERRIVNYPWQFDIPMKGPSLNNNDWSSCCSLNHGMVWLFCGRVEVAVKFVHGRDHSGDACWVFREKQGHFFVGLWIKNVSV